MKANSITSIDKRIVRGVGGLFLGGICGPIVLLLALGLFVGISELIETVLNKGVGIAFGRIIFVTLFYTYLWLFAAIQIGAVIGSVNAITDGGIGVVGIEWSLIIGIAFVIGARLWQIGANHFYMGIVSGIIGGLVGFLTWFIFRDKGKKSRVTKLALIGYSLAFIVITIIGPISYIDFLAGF